MITVDRLVLVSIVPRTALAQAVVQIAKMTVALRDALAEIAGKHALERIARKVAWVSNVETTALVTDALKIVHRLILHTSAVDTV